MPVQLPTPPSTGKETTSTAHSMQSRGSISEQMTPMDQPADSSPAAEKRRGVVVTLHEGEGRKLSIVGVAQQAEASSSSHGTRLSPRTTLMPVVSTSEAGHATIGTDEVLQSEIAWLEDSATRGQSPPSSSDNIQLRTPTMTTAAAILEEDSPNTKAGKMSRRLQAFADATKLEEPMISTRIEVFGRVAVRKDVAIKFLGLSAEARLVEEVKAEDEEEWVEAPVASSSKAVVRPSWPDQEAPWALAGGSRREKRQREETERATLLKRYLENASDSDSEDEVTQPRTFANGRGKSIVPLVREELASRPRNRWDTPSANALDALRIAVRNRCLPIMKVGCRCGSHDTLNSGVMAQCSSCKTWHHLGCLGIQDENEITDSWWCPDCRTSAAMIMSTPATSVRGYNQSDERSSAFKGEMTNIALAPSPMFNTTYAQGMALARTPANRTVGSPTSRNHRSRILSYGTDMWAYTEDGAPTPSTPAPAARPDRFSTPRIDEAPFDVTSTPSRHLDFNFAQPSLFSLTPLGGRGRLPSTLLLDGTPFRARNLSGAAEAIPSRHDFLKELNKDSTVGVNAMSFGAGGPATPSRWPHQLLGAHNVSPSPFGHKRNLSGNKLSSMRSSSRSGLGHEALESDAEGEDEL
ncbi:hypothetical protein BCR39DRAFT_195717 [Naematelia encephala]|uniref:PHD-type domain-containing protein n=1 Tax=Naematelia encephala TaxID=71784 RepID=A0A1Y2BHP9_9TREE|nr:hypothetical protein BCR39DRAFT_195717 [Naematelia encephala]